MSYKTGRTNHNFQIAYFLLGKCHTPDGAYALAFDLLEDRERALAAARTNVKRAKAKKMAAEAALQRLPIDSPDRLMVEADLEEMAEGAAHVGWLVAQAEREAQFIKDCIAKIEPLRRYGHLPDHEAFEAAQRDEWRLELIHRAECFIGSQGFIPADELATMRAHPDFATSILPEIEFLQASRPTGSLKFSERGWTMPVLLTGDNLVQITDATHTSH